MNKNFLNIDLFSSAYDHSKIEIPIYKWWEENNFFTPEKQRELGLVNDLSDRYCITIPPPNITGFLHLGHALTLSIEDLMTRLARMQQKETLFLPGTDHAGIATQSVVERELRKKGSSRIELGREKFLEKVWEWKDKYHHRITEQCKRMGISADWNREQFTLNPNLSKAVRTAFVHLYKKGLIYRGKYMVNWCPGMCESAISDIEAEPKEEQSFLWYLKYPIVTNEWKGPKEEWGSGLWAKGATDFIIIATTRPETLLGDTAIAISLNHPIFKKFAGKKAVLPVIGRKIPIFEDKYVDPEFGTGALKITPGHDPNDYEIGIKHNLPMISVIDEKGNMIVEETGKYAGMNRFECRSAIIEDLEKEGLMEKIEPYTHAVNHCHRCNTIIEPLISTQWFVRMKQLADVAIDFVTSGQTTIIPNREMDRYLMWMNNIRDWCISRQLWWGHRIPIWYCSNGHEICEEEDPTQCPICKDTNLTQDEDVLDTWFSSGLWPFSTLGWPKTDTADFKRFYPTTVRETGYDILFFWVAREMMLAGELTKQAPYKTIYLHGLVRNKKGEKISKSMENIEEYDPLNMIDKWGADSLRFTLLSSAIPGKDIKLIPKDLERIHKFCNKLLQSSKYVFGYFNDNKEILFVDKKFIENKLTLADRWILSRINRIIKNFTISLEEYNFNTAMKDIYGFYWDEFCDWYIEATKTRMYSKDSKDQIIALSILAYVLDISYKLLHPAMPYITEALWQYLPQKIRKEEALIIAKWPVEEEIMIDDEVEQDYDLIRQIIRGIRSICSDFNIPPGTKVPILIETSKIGLIDDNKNDIIKIANVDPTKFTIQKSINPPKHAGRLVFGDTNIFIPLEDLIDLELETQRVKKQLDQMETQIKKIKKLLNSSFAERAPSEIVEKERNSLKESETRANQLREQLLILE